MNNSELRQLAAVGLRLEITRLNGLLRELEGDGVEERQAPAENGEPVTRKKRRKMSAAKRAEISARMRDYWAAKRKGAKGKRTTSAT